MIVEIWHPGTPGIPAVPARYIETSGPGWASGAVSIPITSGDGGYKWTIPTSVVGVFIGLASKYPGSGYFGIEHALLFSRGVVDIYERGQKLGTLGPYVSGDEFTMFRQAGRVWFLKNGIKEYDRPSLLTGTFRLAATEYLTGDTVVDAATFEVGATMSSGDGFTVMRPLQMLGFETIPGSYGVAELEPLTSEGREDGHGWSTSSLGSLLALGGDRPYGIGRGTLAALTSYGESGLIKPEFATGLTTIPPVYGIGRMIPGGVGVGVMTSKIMALGSDRPIAQGVAELQPMFAWGAEAIELRGSVMKLRSRYRVVASVRESELNAAQLTGPSLVMAASTGSQARLRGPKLSLAASGTVPVLARLSRSLPALELVASGTVTESVGAVLTLQDSFSVVASTGAQARLSGPGGFTTAGLATAVERAEAHLAGPGFYSVQAEVSRGRVATAVLTGPALVPAPSGEAWLVGPSLTMRAVAGEVVSVTYESYAINLSTGAVTRYVDFPFDRVLRFGDRHFGVRPDGVYALTGDTDNGVPILAEVRTFKTDFRTSNLKRTPYVYLAGRVDGGMQVGVQANEGEEYFFPAATTRELGTQAVRAKIAQGIRGNYFGFAVTNPDGENFDIEKVHVLLDNTKRSY